MNRKIIDDVYNAIAKFNSNEGLDSIPQSDILYKNFMTVLGIDKPLMLHAVDMLKKSHKIFIIEISKEDTERDIEKIDCYVVADLEILRRLRVYFENALLDLYDKQFHKKMGLGQVIKEIFPKLSMLNNTQLGLIANQAIMLGEYYKMMEKDFFEYSEKWKEDKLSKLVLAAGKDAETSQKSGDIGKNTPGKETSIDAADAKRAIDTGTFKDFSNDLGKYSIDKILNIYGANFFFRVYLRKYEFDYLKEIIEKGLIIKKGDLELLKNMIQKIKSNIDIDPKLGDYSTQISSLERVMKRGLYSGMH